MERTIWALRHGERIDQASPRQQRAENATKSGYSSDNPPLSERGRQQAKEAGLRLADEHIDHVFSSPFSRCVHTSQLLLDAAGKQLPINVEPGLCEVLSLVANPPGFHTPAEQKKSYPLVNESYSPVYTKKLDHTTERNDFDCRHRVKETMTALLDKYSGNLLVVGHGASIGAVHHALVDNWVYPGLCSVSKFVVNDTEKPLKFKRELSGCVLHLSDKSNLRAY